MNRSDHEYMTKESTMEKKRHHISISRDPQIRITYEKAIHGNNFALWTNPTREDDRGTP